MENLRWASPVRCSGLCRIRRSSLVLVNGKSQVTGLKWWSGVPPMHTHRGPLNPYAGSWAAVPYISSQQDPLLVESPHRWSDGDKSASLSRDESFSDSGDAWAGIIVGLSGHVVTKSSGGETEGIKSRRMRRGAITTIASCLRMRRKPAPAWGARNPDKLNFFSAAYNELLALLSPDLRASDWPCAQVPGFDTFQIRFFLRG